MNINYKHFGIIKVESFKGKSFEQKLNFLEKLGYLKKQYQYSNFIRESETKIREQVRVTFLLELKNPDITYVFAKNIPTEIKNYLLVKYFDILEIPCKQFITKFNDKTFHLTQEEKRKLAAKQFKKYINKIKASSIPNPLSNKTSYLDCAFKEKLENNSFLINNFELLENYLIGNESYFNKKLINEPIFDRFYEIETNFIIVNWLNEKYQFEDFLVEVSNLKLFLCEHPNFKDLFIEDVAFIYINLFIENTNNNKQIAISLFYYLSEHNYIQNNKIKYKDFLKLFYGLKISKIVVDENNFEHQKRYDLFDKVINRT